MVADGTEGDRQSLSPEQQLILTTVGRELPSRQFANLKARGKVASKERSREPAFPNPDPLIQRLAFLTS